jgi:hypothetical protein
VTAHPAPAVIDALYARCVAATPLTGVRLFDGPPLEEDPPLSEPEDNDVVAVGLSLVPLLAVASGERRAGWGEDRTERFDLACLAQSFSDDPQTLPAARLRTFTLLDAVGTLLDTDPTLGGACDRAQLATWSYRPLQLDIGVLAIVDFAIRVDATRFEGV